MLNDISYIYGLCMIILLHDVFLVYKKGVYSFGIASFKVLKNNSFVYIFIEKCVWLYYIYK